jgi:hypothetical protein
MNSKCVFKLLNFACNLFLMLLKKTPPPPALENLSLLIFSFIVHYKYSNYLIYQKFHDMNGYVKLRAVSKLSTFF